MDRMKIIGLVGGVASGKSLVAQLLVERGAALFDADRVGHEVLANDPQVRDALVNRWGPSILAAEGRINRAAVAACVFAAADDPARQQAAAERQFLESLMHPRIRQRFDEESRRLAASGCPALVLDAPLLLEAGWGPLCDKIVLVDAPEAVRRARAEARGWTADDFARREAAQWPVDKKRAAAHAVLANDGDVAALRGAVAELWTGLALGS